MFRMAHVTDLHLVDTREDRAMIARLVASLHENAVDHALVTGDVTHDGDLRILGRFDRELRRSGWTEERCTVLGGNHDLDARRGFRRRFGWEPATWRKLHGGRIGLVTADSVKEGGAMDRRVWSPRGWLTADELAALDDAMGRCSDCPVRVLALHHHVFHTPASDRDWLMTLGTILPGRLKMWGPLENADELLELARTHEIHAIFSGHSHTPRARRLGGIRCFIGGSTSMIEEYRVFDFDDTGRFTAGWARIRR